MAADGGENTGQLFYQLTCRRPAWPFEDWRYDVVTRYSDSDAPPAEQGGVWYTQEECQTVAEVLRASSVNEDYPFRKQRIAAVLKKTLANSKNLTKTSEKTTKSKLRDDSRDVYSLDKVALGKKFFHVLVNMTVPEYPDKLYHLRVDILETLRASGKYLRQNCDLFADCNVVPVGSMADGSKVFTTDDVDFLITLPVIRDTVKDVKICDSSDLIPVVRFVIDEDQREENLLKRLRADLEVAVQSSLKPDWTLESVTSSLDRKTQIVGLKCKTNDDENLTVTLNVSFAIPIPKECLDGREHESHPDKIEGVPLQSYTLRYLKERDSYLVAILSDDSLKRCTVSLDRDMASVLTNDVKGTGVAHVYSLAKRVISLFFPQVFQDKSWQTMIPSHVILNIVLYLCSYRKSAKMWTLPRLPERLIEVLLILERCAEDEAVNLFFLPGMVALPVYTSNAYYHDPKKSRFLCSEEDFSSETFDCRILDEDVLAALSGHSDLTMHFAPYFSTMKHNEWTFPDKLEELSDALQEIFKCPVPRMWRNGRFSSIETDSGLPPPAEKRRVSVRQIQQKAAASKAKGGLTRDKGLSTTNLPKSANSSMSTKTSKSSIQSSSSSKPLIAPKPQKLPSKPPQKRNSDPSLPLKEKSETPARSKQEQRRRKRCCPIQ